MADSTRHDPRPLAAKRVIVTGASRGIGRAIAMACAESGALVGINFHRGEDAAREVADLIGAQAMLLPFDVRDATAVAAAFEAFERHAGGIDALVNNAGIIRPALLASMSDADVDEVVRTNLLGTIFCTRAALSPMIRQRGGVLLNISSVAAARPVRGQTVYAATKGAIEAFTRAVAVEYGRRGIRSHCIQPGPVDTDMMAATKALVRDEILQRVPLKRFVTSEEIAGLAVFLLSDRGRAITGGTYTIDGGFVAG
jgi:3-oxoacyl-[acyl-carrier protein] reductase